jgi:hypothetical protein
MGVPMDLDFNLLETGSLFLAILMTSFTLQVIFPFLFPSPQVDLDTLKYNLE